VRTTTCSANWQVFGCAVDTSWWWFGGAVVWWFGGAVVGWLVGGLVNICCIAEQVYKTKPITGSLI
jgi:hypothetical protein